MDISDSFIIRVHFDTYMKFLLFFKNNNAFFFLSMLNNFFFNDINLGYFQLILMGRNFLAETKKLEKKTLNYRHQNISLMVLVEIIDLVS